jgi:hypothetical protein
MNAFSTLKGMLFDLDGVLYTGSQPIEGAIETIRRIRSSHLRCRFVTNTSTLSQASPYIICKSWGTRYAGYCWRMTSNRISLPSVSRIRKLNASSSATSAMPGAIRC